MRAAADPARQSDARMYAIDWAKSQSVVLSSRSISPVIPQSMQDCIDAALRFACEPSNKAYVAWLKLSSGMGSAILRASDNRRATLPTISKVAALPDPIAPLVKQACSTSLEWQTKPAIGVNPMHVAMLAQHSGFSNPIKKERHIPKRKPKRVKIRSVRAALADVAARPHCVTTLPKLSLNSWNSNRI